MLVPELNPLPGAILTWSQDWKPLKMIWKGPAWSSLSPWSSPNPCSSQTSQIYFKDEETEAHVHFKDEETEAYKGKVACPESHNSQLQSVRPVPELLGP